MRQSVPEKLERGRIRNGPYGTKPGSGWDGAYLISIGQVRLRAICGVGLGWEHVSASVYKRPRTPTWEEMCAIKDLFWGPEEVVMQLHPRHSEYVNNHLWVLHLWRPIDQDIPTPPATMVGYRGLDIPRDAYGY